MQGHREETVKLRIVVVVVCAAFLAASAYAQTTDFIGLVRTGTPENVQVAIVRGEDANTRDENGVTALMDAARYNPNPDVITTLQEAGADPNARDMFGMTALMAAAIGNPSTEAIVSLLEAGSDLNARDSADMTPLMYSVANPNPIVIITLLKAGADVNARDVHRRTAFDRAQKNAKLKGTIAFRMLAEAQ
jgi:ankyrin repeat protein